MLNTFGLSKEEKILFNEFYDQISTKYSGHVVDDINIPLYKVELFKNYSHYAYQQALKIYEKFSQAYIGIIQVKYNYCVPKGGSRNVLEFQTWAWAYLPKKFGHLVIKRETFKDKLIELFQPLELDFPEDKKFSKKFYVLTKDPQKANELLNDKLRQELNDLRIDNFQMEVVDNFLIIGNNKSLGNDEVLDLANFVKRICDIHY